MAEDKNNLENSLAEQTAKEQAWKEQLKSNPVKVKEYSEDKKQEDVDYGVNKSEDEMAEDLQKAKVKDRIKNGLKNVVSNKLKQSAVGQKLEKVKKAKEDLNKLKTIYRIINGTTAVTLIGLLVTWAVMTGQFILGNVLKSKKIPKLDGVEAGLWALLTFVLGVALLIIFLLIYIMLNPCEGLESVGLGSLTGVCNLINFSN